MGVADPAEPLVATGTPAILAGTGAVPLRTSLNTQWEEAPVLAEDTVVDQNVRDAEASVDDDLDELLVEEISIDGMCGVY
jgi:mycofactocin precursor